MNPSSGSIYIDSDDIQHFQQIIQNELNYLFSKESRLSACIVRKHLEKVHVNEINKIRNQVANIRSRINRLEEVREEFSAKTL